MDKTPNCRDCRHCKYSGGVYLCTQPDVRRDNLDLFEYIAEARMDENLCGKTGHLFVAREPQPTDAAWD